MSYAILLSSLLVMGSHTPATVFQGSAPTWARVMVRQTENFKLVEQGKVQRRVEAAKGHRTSRNSSIGSRNRSRVAEADKAPRALPGKGVLTAARKVVKTDYAIYVDAEITLPVQDENGRSLADFPLEISREIEAAPGKPKTVSSFEKVVSNSNGQLVLKNVRVPATLRLKVQSSEWELEGDDDGQVFAVLLPNATETQFRKQPGDRAGKTIELSRVKKNGIVTISQRSEIFRKMAMTTDAARLRRTVADFEMPKPSDPVAIRGLQVHTFLGSKEVALEDAGASWKFRVPRDEIEDTDATTFVVQVDKNEAKFGGTVASDKIDFYGGNRLPTPALKLEAFAEGSIVFAGKPVDRSFPLSVLQWEDSSGVLSASTSGLPSTLPTVMTGKQALKILGVEDKLKQADRDKKHPADWIEVPNPGREEGRYGQWLWLEGKGLGLHCRWELDNDNADKRRNGRKFLPGRSSHGILEGIRVTKPEGGQIGVLKVGATRSEVLEAFGPPDNYTIDVINIIDLGAGFSRNQTIYGSSKIEAWDDTFLYGGVRVKWNGNLVSWFEVARPAQLLYNGTRAFNPSVSRAVYIRNVTSNTGDASVAARVRQWVSLSSGVTTCDSESAAELIVDAKGTLSSSDRGGVRHQRVVKEAVRDYKGNVKRDKNGNIKYEDKWVDESFLCPEATASFTIYINVSDRAGNVVSSFSLDNNASGSSPYGHKQGQPCRAPSLDAVQAAAMNGAPNWRRTFANQMSEGSDMTGCVLNVNYKTGQILINLGARNGIRKASASEGTELALYLLHSVDPKTGAIEGDIDDERIIGPGFREWLEVEQVGDDWCVARPKTKNPTGQTVTAYGIIPRLIDPASGLVRVRVVAKRGKG